MKRCNSQLGSIAIGALATALAACSGATDISEFVQACVKTRATQQKCECAAHAAAAKLSPELFNAMVYDMEGKQQELAAIANKMSVDQRGSFAQQQFAVMSGCMKGS